MPRLATDYSKTIIYKIICKDKKITDFYVGHTTDFNNRKHVHKHDSKNNEKNKKKIYVIINNNGGWENWDMIEIEKYNCVDSNEARAREKYWEDKLQPTLNTSTPSFVSFDGLTSDNIVGKDKVETNVLKRRFREMKLKEELIFLRNENKKLKELLINHLISY